MMNISDEVELQRRYYAETASRYDHMHGLDEHAFALSFMVAALDYLQVRSVLDIGSGTGRVLLHIKKLRPDLRVVGIEPVKELRDVGYANGLSADELIDGDATALPFPGQSFDLVCEFAVLHHIKQSERVVAEMLRVSKKAIFISDSNNFGQGSPSVRWVKQALNLLGLWKAADFIKTRGKGYSMTQGDGLFYSYSVFDNYRQIQKDCKIVHVCNTLDGDINPYRTASHVALLGVKK